MESVDRSRKILILAAFCNIKFLFACSGDESLSGAANQSVGRKNRSNRSTSTSTWTLRRLSLAAGFGLRGRASRLTATLNLFESARLSRVFLCNSHCHCHSRYWLHISFNFVMCHDLWARELRSRLFLMRESKLRAVKWNESERICISQLNFDSSFSFHSFIAINVKIVNNNNNNNSDTKIQSRQTFLTTFEWAELASHLSNVLPTLLAETVKNNIRLILLSPDELLALELSFTGANWSEHRKGKPFRVHIFPWRLQSAGSS